MADLNVSSADYTAMDAIDQTSESVTDFRRAVQPAEQDYPGTRYYPSWSKWFGYYKTIPQIQSVINKKAIWSVGKGFEAKPGVTKTLDKIRGCGKDTFNSIIFNQIVSYTACGDSFAEIIKNKRGEIKNLKPINPGSMSIISNENGIIDKYIQTVNYGQTKKRTITFSPDDIFHLPWMRLGDEPHGRSTIEKIEWIIEAMNEAQKDMRIVFHRYVKPLMLVKADTDDATEIAALKVKLDKAVENMENMIVPKDTVEMERMSIPQYSTLDPLPWMEFLEKQFLIAEGVPEVILGFGRETTEASSKILYLAFQQNIEHNQLFLEEQMKAQLGIDVEFNFPENISPELTDDVRKERNINNFEVNKDVRGNTGTDRGQARSDSR